MQIPLTTPSKLLDFLGQVGIRLSRVLCGEFERGSRLHVLHAQEITPYFGRLSATASLLGAAARCGFITQT